MASMQVSDKGGEISASVEETNRIRASLGLQPLAEKKEDPAVAAHAARVAAQKEEDAQEAMRDRLERAKEARLRTQKLGGKSLGELLADEEMDSAAAWVLKSRTQEETRKVKRKQMRKQGGNKGVIDAQSRFDEMDALEQEESQIGGALLGHSTDAFASGESVVLTLADAPIVQTDGEGYELNEGDEVLENVNLAEDDRRKRARELSRGGGLAGDDSALLHKYDDEAERTTVRLDASGSVDEAKRKKLEAVKAKLAAQQGSGGPMKEYDLTSGTQAPQLTTGADYMDASEVPSFKKPAGAKTKKLRRKVKEPSEDSGALDLDAMAAETEQGDHGSRQQRAQKMRERESAAAAARAERAERFERALDVAEHNAHARLRGDGDGDVEMADGAQRSADAAPRASGENGADGGGHIPAAAGALPAATSANGAGASSASTAESAEESAEVDAELYAALSRARRLGKMSAERRNEDFAAQRLREQLEAAERWAKAVPNGIAHEGAVDATELTQLEFSETGEFCKAVRAKDEADESELPSHAYKQMRAQGEKRERDTAEGGASAMPRKPKREAGESDGGSGESDDEEESDDGGVIGETGADFVYEKPASSGMGAALQMARTRGMLGEERESAGRMFDMKGAGLHAYEEDKEKSGVNLQYYDEFGRKMTQKQAFRQLSWKFHGKMPSKKRRERRMAEVEKQMAEQSKDRAMEYMGALQQAQQSTKSAHVVLSGAQAIKTSDVLKQSRAPSDRMKSQLRKKAKASSTGGFDTAIPTSGLNSSIPL
uniref:SART-1 family protein n=1 Tax=Chrysotila carterae TaxID=13221 RepID=A0A7S4C0S0_CHRCT|mmetsp:Transcript_22934/g.50164  ORF Transcript_22934/g.50164 Transcript_22934/m.50164 type:complete len:776 (+) Transcript_22934:158-2485(+)